MTDLHRLSIREMAEGLKSAQFSSREVDSTLFRPYCET